MLQLISIICLILSFAIGVKMRSMKKKINPEYMEARLKALNATTEDKSMQGDKVFCLIQELDLESGRATLVIFPNGQTALYASSNAPEPSDNSEQPEYVVAAASAMIDLAQKQLSRATKSYSTDFPPKDCTQYHLLTPNGRFSLTAPTRTVMKRGTELNPLYEAFENLMNQIALAKESRQYASGSKYVMIED